MREDLSFFLGMNDRAVLITLEYPPERGGVARYLGSLVNASRGGMRVVVDKTHAAEGPGEMLRRNMFRRAWPHWWPLTGVCKEFSQSKLILVSHVLPIGTAARIARIFGGAPYAVLCHGLDIRLASRSTRKRWLFRHVCKHAKLVMTNSEATAIQLAAVAPDVKPLVLTPGVEQRAFPLRAQARTRLGIAHDEIVILSVARLIPRKGIDVLLEAANGLSSSRPIRILVIGNGPELESLKKLKDKEASTAHGLRPTAEFIIDANDEMLDASYAASDIFCLAVKDDAQDMEGFGMVYLEAALAGLPSVATATGGVPEAVVDGQTGILVPPNDAEALRTALQKLIDDEPLRRALGHAGRLRAERDFTWEDRWNAFKNVMEK